MLKPNPIGIIFTSQAKTRSRDRGRSAIALIQHEEFELRLHPLVTETVSIEIPADTLESLKKVAANGDMSLDALLKFYIGKSLRQDLAKLLNGFDITDFSKD